jgi:hypothetical protein
MLEPSEAGGAQRRPKRTIAVATAGLDELMFPLRPAV